jgi:hypothetical protein
MIDLMTEVGFIPASALMMVCLFTWYILAIPGLSYLVIGLVTLFLGIPALMVAIFIWLAINVLCSLLVKKATATNAVPVIPDAEFRIISD